MPPMTMLHDDLSELDLVWERVIKRGVSAFGAVQMEGQDLGDLPAGRDPTENTASRRACDPPSDAVRCLAGRGHQLGRPYR